MLICNVAALIVSGIHHINNLYVLLACRILQGILTGSFMSIIPIYINELCPKQIVGVFGVFTQIFVVLALVVNYAIGTVLTKSNTAPFTFFRIMISYDSVLILVQTVLLLVNYIPESPNYLLKKNKNDQAREVIAMFTVPSHV